MAKKTNQSKEGRKPNKLVNEKSPYLKMHAYNPVNWYPWGKEAFDTAKKEGKPIFLSIGYFSCHWCSVMSKESFEDPEIAKILNENFVCIKVDREERPDIDHYFIGIAQIVMGNAGWPLTIIMTPDIKPFFVATYLPKESIGDRIGLKDVLKRIIEQWKYDRKTIEYISSKIVALRAHLATQYTKQTNTEITNQHLLNAYTKIRNKFDWEHGGTKKAPKFPIPHTWVFLTRIYEKTGIIDAIQMTEKTLTEMFCGAIYDHVGGGFHRYAVDERWEIPHFEKMLYDQATTIWAYSEAYQLTKNPLYKHVIDETIKYLTTKLKHPTQGYYSSENAETNSKEGIYYLWTYNQLRNTLPPENLSFLEKNFNIKTTTPSKKNILKINNHGKKQLQQNTKQFLTQLKQTMQILKNEREKRDPPEKDEKILTDWNGLITFALAKAYETTQNTKYLTLATENLDYLWNTMTKPPENNDPTKIQIIHGIYKNRSLENGYLDDYVFLAIAALETFQQTMNPDYLEKTIIITNTLISKFWDQKNKGFFFNEKKPGSPPIQLKIIPESSYPTGNSLATLLLVKLSRITGETTYEQIAYQSMQAVAELIQEHPEALTALLIATNLFLSAKEVIITAKQTNDTLKNTITQLKTIYSPNKIMLIKTTNNQPQTKQLEQLIPFLKHYPEPKTQQPIIHVCQNYACKQPTTNIIEAIKLLTT